MAESFLPRCPWLDLSKPDYVDYHDSEWGRPVHENRLLFEYLSLEGAQAGLSWYTVLKKRDGYRKAFYDFDIERVASMSGQDVERLRQDSGIVRNKAKIESTIGNAHAILNIQREFGSFDTFLWNFVEGKPIVNHVERLDEYPTKTELSNQLSKELVKRGCKFVGPTIMYAFMQAVGMINDHSLNCFLHPVNKYRRF